MIGENISTVLAKWGINQGAFSDLFENMTRHKISSYARGVSEPSIAFMIRLEELTGISIKRLFYDRLEFSDLPQTPLNPTDKQHQLVVVTKPKSSQYLEERIDLLEQKVDALEKKIFD